MDKQCELTCRPAGYRFYVRQAERVRDGTPCFNVSSNDVCVEGQCLVSGFNCACVRCLLQVSEPKSLLLADKAQNLALVVSCLLANLNLAFSFGVSPVFFITLLWASFLSLFLSFALLLSDFAFIPLFCSWQESDKQQLPIHTINSEINTGSGCEMSTRTFLCHLTVPISHISLVPLPHFCPIV